MSGYGSRHSRFPVFGVSAVVYMSRYGKRHRKRHKKREGNPVGRKNDSNAVTRQQPDYNSMGGEILTLQAGMFLDLIFQSIDFFFQLLNTELFY